MIIHIQKRLGETPNSLISRFKHENPEYSKKNKFCWTFRPNG